MFINELHLFTNVLENQRDFYTRILGLPLRESGEGWFTLEVGDSTLTFSALEHAAPSYHHFAFNIPENMFPEAKAWLAERVTLVGSPEGKVEFNFENWNAHAVYFTDPEGNIGELIARHDLPNSQTSPFNSQHLLNISEIGLPLDDVVQFAQTIQAQIGCPVYRTEIEETFTPMGDEHGLFILVKKGRMWYPDNTMPATDAALKVLVSTLEGTRFRIEGPPYHITAL